MCNPALFNPFTPILPGLRNRKICRVGERRERGDFIYGPRLLCGGNEGFDLSVRVIEVTIPKKYFLAFVFLLTKYYMYIY